MVVDEDPFPQPVDVNMVIPNFEKLDFPKFKLVVDGREDELCPSAFECLKGKAVVKEEGKLCVRCQKEVGKNPTKRFPKKLWTDDETTTGHGAFENHNESKAVNQNVLEDEEVEDTKVLKEEPLKGECVGKLKFEHRKNDEDEDDAGQLIAIQYGTMSPVMANNYLLANEFKNKEHDDEITEENEEVACTLECGEDTSKKMKQ
ncbi:hypothetical protein Adt_41791 [Abeliophyllum distichum]|uniref:Uncharacterized protein n=1 Tax=Abeliophyllum distichum TaxID=126358 RepID=A0ABD1PPY1_9LAMI